MRNKWLVLMLLLFLGTGCSGTEFPNPGDEDSQPESDKAANTPVSAESEENTALDEALVAGNASTTVPFSAYGFNDCVRLMTPGIHFSLNSTTLSPFVFRRREASLLPEILSIAPELSENKEWKLTVSEDQVPKVQVEFDLNQNLSQVSAPSEMFLALPVKVENCQVQQKEASLLLEQINYQVLHKLASFRIPDLPEDRVIEIETFEETLGNGRLRLLKFVISISESSRQAVAGEQEPVLNRQTYTFVAELDKL
ncbi:hypothetical protein WDW89_02115 [Deltaproteobacteria bacterium TL4]